jgi:hypothetical protein
MDRCLICDMEIVNGDNVCFVKKKKEIFTYHTYCFNLRIALKRRKNKLALQELIYKQRYG